MNRVFRLLSLAIAFFHQVYGFPDQSKVKHSVNLLNLSYRFYQKPSVYDLKIAVRFFLLENNGLLKLGYSYRERIRYQLNHYFLGFTWGTEYFEFKTLFDLAHPPGRTDVFYENDLFAQYKVKLGMVDLSYQNLLAWEPVFKLFHGGEVEIYLDPDRLSLVGLAVRQVEYDYRLIFSLQFGFKLNRWSVEETSWFFRIGYRSNPGQISLSIHFLSNWFEIGTLTFHRTGWGVEQEFYLGMFPYSSHNSSSDRLEETRVIQPSSLKKNFKEWFQSLKKEKLTQIISDRGMDPVIDAVWVASIWDQRFSLDHLEDLIEFGLEDQTLNFHYYRLIKTYFDWLED